MVGLRSQQFSVVDGLDSNLAQLAPAHQHAASLSRPTNSQTPLRTFAFHADEMLSRSA